MIIPFITPWLISRMGKGFGTGISWAILVGALALAFVLHGNHRHAAGWADREARYAADQARADARQRVIEDRAAAARHQELQSGAQRDAARQKELTDATAQMPDERPSARRRARICAELQQQARAAGGPVPACGHVQPR